MKPNLLRVALLIASLCVGIAAAQGQRKVSSKGFAVVEAGIPEMQAAMKKRRATSRQLVLEYLTRIARYEDRLKAAMVVNPRALEEAEELDHERAAGKVRGPLHGIPVALKDNIHTTNMPTTGGALAFDGFVPPYEATLTRNLREAGAIIIAKTTMTELANWVAGAPTPMPGGYNSLAGFSFNPYDPQRDPRPDTFDGRPALSTGGSSSGIGTTTNFWAANVGTETSGSILSPANWNMLVGIKPTVGRISRYGVIPITSDQDTPGPLAKSVTDAAILLGAMEGAKPDPHDPATEKCVPPPNRDYTRYLRRGGLKGARIGVPRAYFYDPLTPPGETQPRGGINPDQSRVIDEAIAVLRQQGAVMVDPADIPSVVTGDEQGSYLRWNRCTGIDGAKGKDANCSTVFKYGMKRDFTAWLATLGPLAPVKSLTELREFNRAHTAAGAIKFGQTLLDISDEMDVEQDRARYEADRAKDLRLAATEGIDAVMQKYSLDALVFPGYAGNAIAAAAGYPTIIVPFGMIPNAPDPPFPDGFSAKPAPYGVSFTGLACSEPRLIELGYAFEQATKRRVPPPMFP